MDLSRLVTTIRTNNLVDIGFRDVAGNNLPHVLIVRNKNEFIDQSIGQFGNSLLNYGGGYLFCWGIEKARPLFRKSMNSAGHHWFNIGKSFSFFAVLAGMVVACAQLRNWVTLKRTKTTDYVAMVGEVKQAKLTPQSQKEKERIYLHKIGKMMAVSGGISAAILAITFTAIKRHWPVPKLIQKLDKAIGLPEGKFSQMKNISDALFGSGAAYLGWFLGVRDPYEMKEVILRFSAFLFAFFIFPVAIERNIEKLALRKQWKLLGSSENLAYMAKFVSSVVMCASIPSFLNIFLTHQRVQKAQRQKTEQNAHPQKLTTVLPTSIHFQQLKHQYFMHHPLLAVGISERFSRPL